MAARAKKRAAAAKKADEKTAADADEKTAQAHAADAAKDAQELAASATKVAVAKSAQAHAVNFLSTSKHAGAHGWNGMTVEKAERALRELEAAGVQGYKTRNVRSKHGFGRRVSTAKDTLRAARQVAARRRGASSS